MGPGPVERSGGAGGEGLQGGARRATPGHAEGDGQPGVDVSDSGPDGGWRNAS